LSLILANLILGKYMDLLRRNVAFRLHATDKIFTILRSECTVAESIVQTSKMFLKDLFGLKEGDSKEDPVAAVSAQLQSLELKKSFSDLIGKSLQVRVSFMILRNT